MKNENIKYSEREIFLTFLVPEEERGVETPVQLLGEVAQPLLLLLLLPLQPHTGQELPHWSHSGRFLSLSSSTATSSRNWKETEMIKRSGEKTVAGEQYNACLLSDFSTFLRLRTRNNINTWKQTSRQFTSILLRCFVSFPFYHSFILRKFLFLLYITGIYLELFCLFKFSPSSLLI